MRKLSLLAVLAMVAGMFTIGVQPTTAAAPYCTGTVTGGTLNMVIVPAGTECVLDGVNVIGGVTVNDNASLIACDTTIGGWLRANRAYVNIDNGTVIGGGVDIVPPTSSVISVGTTQTDCSPQNACQGQYCDSESSSLGGLFCPYSVNGPTMIRNGGPYVFEFMIGGCGYVRFNNSVQIISNNLPVHITSSKIAGNLSCYYNTPAATLGTVHVTGRIVGCAQQSQPPPRGD